MIADLYWIPLTKTGRLATGPRPRAGDWLDDELKAWRRDGVDVVVCLLTPPELLELGLTAEAQSCQKNDMMFLSYPIEDFGLPESSFKTLELVDQINELLNQDKAIAIHCRAGIGRSTMIAACVLARQGIDAQTALQGIEQARGLKVPDTEEQRQWVIDFTQSWRSEV